MVKTAFYTWCDETTTVQTCLFQANLNDYVPYATGLECFTTLLPHTGFQRFAGITTAFLDACNGKGTQRDLGMNIFPSMNGEARWVKQVFTPTNTTHFGLAYITGLLYFNQMAAVWFSGTVQSEKELGGGHPHLYPLGDEWLNPWSICENHWTADSPVEQKLKNHLCYSFA